MDWEFIETQKGGRALLRGGYQYLRIRTGIEGREFWVMLSHDVWPELTMPLKKNYRQLEQRVQ